MLHGVDDIENLNRVFVIGQHWSKLYLCWLELNDIVDTLTLNIQNELLRILLALEGKLLGEWFVRVRREHDIDG